MKSGQRQTQKMQQKLTPQQLMLMQLIQMPVTTLEQRLKEEVEKNPVLEVAETPSDLLQPLPDSTLSDDAGLGSLASDTDDDDYSYRERQERDRNQDAHEPVFVAETSVFDRLAEQLSMRTLTDRQRTIAAELVGSLDDSGYLGRDVALIANDLAFTQGIEVTPDEVLEVLRTMQRMDPPGIAARNLQECLSLQLHRAEVQDEATRLATQVVDRCFEAFAGHNYNRITDELGITSQQLQEASARIRRLNPKPAAVERESPGAHYIVPDFVVTRSEGGLTLMLNDRYLPRLQKNQYYQEMLQQLQTLPTPSASERQTLDFLRESTVSADTLVNTLQQRHATLLGVMRAILRWQYRFFLTGDSADLRPLLQKDVAQQTGYDISTISRVVNSKYVQTEFGTFLLKECFSQSIVGEDGEAVATEAVRQALLSIVETEDKNQPLSDEQLASALRGKGYPVARRTVAKYREMLGIAPARLRRSVQGEK